jgi:hypothetical protein
MAKKRKIPKTIAGVKVPKPLRRGLRDLAASQNGRKALTDALVAATAALVAAQAPPPAKPARRGKAAANAGAPSKASQASQAKARAATAEALEDAARSFTDALKRHEPSQPPAATPPSAATH